MHLLSLLLVVLLMLLLLLSLILLSPRMASSLLEEPGAEFIVDRKIITFNTKPIKLIQFTSR